MQSEDLKYTAGPVWSDGRRGPIAECIVLNLLQTGKG